MLIEYAIRGIGAAKQKVCNLLEGGKLEEAAGIASS
jgi:hypothetical protein